MSEGITTVVRERCYSGPVSRDENPAAHGNVTRIERRRADGAERRVNVNGRHREVGPWCAPEGRRYYWTEEEVSR